MSSLAADLPESRRWCVHRLSSPSSSSEYGIDNFDRLPDSILIVIFNLIGDVKALGRCCIVSRRFHSLIPLVDNVVVRVDCVISDDPSFSSSSSSSSDIPGAVASDKTRGIFSYIVRYIFGGIVRPFYAIGQILSVPSSKRVSSANSASSSSSSEVSHHSPSEVLKNFKEIRRLRIELPAGELGVDEGVLLKWKADFGSTLDRCVILGASSVLSSKSENANLTHDLCTGEDYGSIPESFYMNGGLKLRVVWTISSLIAASARHYLLQPIISDHETLEFLNLTDALEHFSSFLSHVACSRNKNNCQFLFIAIERRKKRNLVFALLLRINRSSIGKLGESRHL